MVLSRFPVVPQVYVARITNFVAKNFSGGTKIFGIHLVITFSVKVADPRISQHIGILQLPIVQEVYISRCGYLFAKYF